MNALFEASHCFLCNYYIIASKNNEVNKNAVDIFDLQNTLPSQRSLEVVVREIIKDEPLYKGQTKSTICKKCHKNVVDYDSFYTRAQSLKDTILSQYNLTKSVAKIQIKKLSKIVVPGSKLVPLPPKYLIVDRDSIDFKKLSQPSKTDAPKFVLNVSDAPAAVNTTNTATSTGHKRITLDSSLFRSPVKSKEPDLVREIAEMADIAAEKRPMPMIRVSSGAILNFQLPKNFLDATALMKEERRDDPVMNSDEQPMEIDEECSYTMSKASSNVDFNKVFQEHISQPEAIKQERSQTVFDMIEELAAEGEGEGEGVGEVVGEGEVVGVEGEAVGEEGEGEEGERPGYVVGELQYLENEEDDDVGTEAIVMSEGGSLMKVLTSQRLLYGGEEISLIIPQDGTDSRDSNDDSQIELQVSGDEETANAIIAAAKEQGGAFIKVETGEMYRVKSVKSKLVSGDEETETPKQMLVVREGSLYKCQICANTNQTTDADKKETADDECGKFWCSEGAAMAHHLKSAHNTRVHVCSVCGDVFRKRTDFNKHMAQHNGSDASDKKTYECNVCKKKFASATQRESHARRAHAQTSLVGAGGNTEGGREAGGGGGGAHVCAQCNKTFTSKYTHQAHLKTHQDRPRPFACKTCKKTFFTQANLTQHEKTHWGVKDFICKFCNKAFGTQHNLDVHGVVHSGVKPFLCGICGKAFARKAEIRDHIRVHTGERPFSCAVCGARFSQRSNLQSHVRATHAHDARHACQHCPKRFKRRRLLEYHIRASHTGERPYKCDVCKTSFVYPEHFKKHQRIHSGEKPYVCEVCGKSFNTRDNRNAHRFVHSDKKPYECLVCGAGYMRKPLLLAHMNTSGHLTESIVVNQPRVSQEDTATIQIQTMDGTPLEMSDTKIQTQESEEEAKVFITTNGDKKIFLQGSDGKSSLNLVLDGEDEILTQNLVESSEGIDASFLDSITSEDIEKGTQIVANDENGGMVRLVQIQLPNGSTGWIAIN